MDTDALHLGFRLVLRPLLYTALLALAFAPLERLLPLRRRESAPVPGPLDDAPHVSAAPPAREGQRTDVLFATFGAIAAECLKYWVAGALLALGEWFGTQVGVGRHGPLGALPAPLALALGLLLFELGGYAYHRLAHRVPLLWRLHAVHHSSTTMDWLASFRQHPLEIALMTAAQNLPLVLLGLPLGSHALLLLALRIHTVFVHANLRTPSWLAPLIAMPTFHHRHHDRDAHGVNFATLFPWIDRVFGTYDATPPGVPALGILPERPRRALTYSRRAHDAEPTQQLS